MYLKRSVDESKNSNETFVIKSKGLGLYRYPKEYDVPSGCYFSVIKNTKAGITRNGTKTVEVYYILEPYAQHKAKVNNNLGEGYKENKYYVLQSYPIDSQYFDDFADAMSDAVYGVLGEEMNLNDLIDVEEIIFLDYQEGFKIGGITHRRPLYVNEFVEDSE